MDQFEFELHHTWNSICLKIDLLLLRQQKLFPCCCFKWITGSLHGTIKTHPCNTTGACSKKAARVCPRGNLGRDRESSSAYATRHSGGGTCAKITCGRPEDLSWLLWNVSQVPWQVLWGEKLEVWQNLLQILGINWNTNSGYSAFLIMNNWGVALGRELCIAWGDAIVNCQKNGESRERNSAEIN